MPSARSIRRLLLIGLGAGIVVVVGAGVYLVANANSLIAAHKGDLERIASDAVGSSVSLGTLSVSVFPSLSVVIDRTEIKRAPSAPSGIALNNVTLKLNPFALFSGRLAIDTLSLDGPSLTFIKRRTGMELEGLPSAERDAGGSSSASEPSSGSSAAAGAAAPAPFEVSLARFALTNGAITVRDPANNSELVITQIEIGTAVEMSGDKVTLPQLRAECVAQKIPLAVTVTDLTLDIGSHNASFSRATAALGDAEIAFAGSFDAAAKQAAVTVFDQPRLELAAVTAALSPILGDAMQLSGAVSVGYKAEVSLGGAAPAVNGEGSVGLHAVAASVPAAQVSDLIGSIGIRSSGSNHAAKTAEPLALKIGEQTVSLSFDAAYLGNEVVARSFAVELAGGRVSGEGAYALGDPAAYKGSVLAEGLDIARLIQLLPEDKRSGVSGTITRVSASGAGVLGANPAESVNGDLSVAVNDATLPGLNLAAEVLRAVNSLPFLSGSLLNTVPAEQRGALESPDTTITSLTGTFSLRQGVLQTPDLRVVSPIFELEASGTVAVAGEMNLTATMYLNPGLSASMIASTKELKDLTDGQGRIIIPVVLTGVPPKIAVLPNLEKLLATAAGRKLEQKAGELLNRALGGGKKGGGGFGGLFGR